MRVRAAIIYVMNQSDHASGLDYDGPAWCAIRKVLCMLSTHAGRETEWTADELQEMLMDQVDYYSRIDSPFELGSEL